MAVSFVKELATKPQRKESPAKLSPPKIVLIILVLAISAACTPALPTNTEIPSVPSVTPALATKTPIPHISLAQATDIPITTTDPGEYIVIAQLNFWFYRSGAGFEDDSGNRTNPFWPALGYTYDAADQAVVQQQIDWAADYGVDAFSIEWTTPHGIGCCGSMEDTLDNVFLRAPNIDRVRWVIFYDLVLRLIQTPNLNVDFSRGMNFDDPDVYNTFVSDFVHFAKKYFNESHYLKIDDRPVIYIWGTWNAVGDYTGAFEEARQKVADLGYDVYIVGDIITNSFNKRLASVYDASSNFVFQLYPRPKDVGEAAKVQAGIFERWANNIQDLKVLGREENVILQPGWAPQYDDTLYQGQRGQSVVAANKEQVTAMAETAREYAQPAGSQGWKLIWICTWNNWPESTTIEPTIDKGPKYPLGNYQFDFLEVVRDVFGADTFSTASAQ